MEHIVGQSLSFDRPLVELMALHYVVHTPKDPLAELMEHTIGTLKHNTRASLAGTHTPAHHQCNVSQGSYDTNNECGTAAIPRQIIRHSVVPPTSIWAGASTKTTPQNTAKVLVI